LHGRSWGAPPGRGSYIKYCGACHGDDEKGNGPNASTLNEKPTDLTQLAQNNNGTFPAALKSRSGGTYLAQASTRQVETRNRLLRASACS
jgi:cytochrome c553